MPIFPMVGPQIALSFYQQPVPVTDTNFTRSSAGRDVRAITGTRTIQAAVDSAGSKRLEQIFGGSMTDGDIGLFTQAVLYFVDEFDTDPNDKAQSFITFSGKIYRVADFADWTTQANMRVYLAKRHTSIGVGVE